ncbi:Glucose-responsive transcription factor [Taxawa tesnikishii (nom. ined.)]|nr:Glucose-responsive transcription factor [Dothideales sp. JES 119]
MAPSNPASQLLGLTLAGEIDRFRESVESVWGSLNLVHLSYHHCHLLIKRLNPTTEPTELIGHALKVATVLNQRQTPITPLNHHFAALSAMTLCELVDVDKTRTDAIRGIEQISEALGLGRGISGHEESTGWDSAIRELVLKKKARLQAVAGSGTDGMRPVVAGLQHLADAAAKEGAPPSAAEGNVAATAVGNGSDKQTKFDPTMLTRYGYLTALGQGMFHAR